MSAPLTQIGQDFFKLTPEQIRRVRKACAVAFPGRPDMVKAMLARPRDAMRLVDDVTRETGGAK